jgi:hypothetical protein
VLAGKPADKRTLAVFTKLPGEAVEGTWSVTLNVHDAPGPRLPSRKLREEVPVI